MTATKNAEPTAALIERTANGKDPDAGLKDLDFYQRRLPAWRYNIRQRLIPIVRLETPYLAYIQETCRSPFLDSYFAMTANLGTHTFFMAALPICYWCGFPDMGMALVHMLALGVYLSGYVKDMLCLPRPLSPPLQRITMSGSAALEYGFPSTHTTNAVSVAVYCLYQVYAARDSMSTSSFIAYQALFYIYATSISIGRIYCGMHGFFDVVAGAVLGAFIAWLRIAFGLSFDQWILGASPIGLVMVCVVLLLAVRFHPEPADNCPCFEDSVAFTGVVMGIEAGTWSYRHHHPRLLESTSLSAMFNPIDNNLLKAVARVLGGILVIFAWRAALKPMLLRSLPPIFRFVDHWGFRLPRRYFLQARHYGKVPPLPKDDNVLPPASKIPAMLTTLQNPRKRTVSIGPQSEADVREFIANRDQRRRNSRSSRSPSSRIARSELTTGISTANGHTKAANSDEVVLEEGDAATLSASPTVDDVAADSGQEDEQENQRMFDALEKPRIRYDVEVITKLVVYSGIGWLSVEGNPLLFTSLGIA